MTLPTIDSFEFWELAVGIAFALYVLAHVALTIAAVFLGNRRS